MPLHWRNQLWQFWKKGVGKQHLECGKVIELWKKNSDFPLGWYVAMPCHSTSLFSIAY